MSDGLPAPQAAPPVLLNAPAPSVVSRIGAPAAPLAISSPLPGPIGAKGDTGQPGPQGLPGDYGWIRYGEMVGATPRQIPANQVVPFVVQPPIQTTDQLRAPFVGFTFLGSDGVLRARALGDAYLLTVQFMAVPAVVNGYVRIDITIAGNQSGVTGPLKQRVVLLPTQPGVATQVEEEFTLHAQSGFLANGATINLFASVPLTVSSDLIYLDPRTAGQ